jgi:hypothetical protein
MTKQKFSAVSTLTINVEPSSLRDAGYQQAVTSDATTNLVRFVMKHVPDFPESITDEAKAELVSGYQLRFTENNPDVEYAVIDGNYLPVSTLKDIPEKTERVKIGSGFAMSFTQQAFGSLKNDKSPTYNPALHAIVKEWRNRVNKYCSNRFKDLVGAAKRILNEGKDRTRAQADIFSDYLEKTFETMQTRCKVSKVQRSDETANEKLFIAAKVAFFAKWNSGKA